MLRHRAIALVAALSLVPVATALTTGAQAATPTPDAGVSIPATAVVTPSPLAKPRPRYAARIRITEHGIPHITGTTFGDLGFGSGYAAASASICTLADTLLTARIVRV